VILLKLAVLAVAALFFLAVTATAVAGFLVLTGEPKPCVDRGTTPASPPNQALQANWNDIAPRVAAGEAVALSVTEEQAATLARGHLENRDVPVEDLRLAFCPDGTTEAIGRVKLAGLNSDILVKGRLDVDGGQPRVEVDSVQAGDLPSFVAEGLLDMLWKGEEARTLPVDLHILSMDVQNGEAVVVVGP
jgi:hypothetical protein